MSARPRLPAGRFIAPNGRTRTTPIRPYPNVADDVEMVERIREAKRIQDEPECVGPRWLEDYAQVAQLHRSQQHALDVAEAQKLRPMLAAEDRVLDIRRRAKHAHVDMSHEVHIMQRDLERAKRGGRKPPLRVLDRCERLEALLDGIAA